ncbi:hypothetical protein EV127DRAFT_225722 [Xylaria flabelliformis]|nr:hypothetical protein EV127DRAFT_225722 [Xylaria flabelliformis]
MRVAHICTVSQPSVHNDHNEFAHNCDFIFDLIPQSYVSLFQAAHSQTPQRSIMTLADPAIVAIVALLVMCIPGVRWLLRTIRRKLRPQRKPSNKNTVLPLSGRSSPPFDPLNGSCVYPCVGLHAPGGMTRQAAYVWAPPSPIVFSSQCFVAVSMSAAVIWPAVDLPPRRSGRHLSHTSRLPE